VKLDPQQIAIVDLPLAGRVFLEGPAGAGKTTTANQRLLRLLKEGVPGGSILVLTPQRTLAAPYETALRRSRLRAGGLPALSTAGGLARRMVELFWPLAAGPAGFADPDRPPTFLTLETAQYHMARLVRPLLEDGYFESVTVDRNRLYSQIIDNLNKAAVVGFPHTEINQRLARAWEGEPGQTRVYADAQECANRFRSYCLAHNLLDFSLQVETFWRHLWPLPICREHLTQSYRHLIVDNLEEDTPFAHDLLAGWLPLADSALLLYDQDAGYRQFLGADPASGHALHALCDQVVLFSQSLVTPPELQTLNAHLARALDQPAGPPTASAPPDAARAALRFQEDLRFYPQMLDWAAHQIADLLEEGASPGEIVVLAPFLSDALRYSLMERLARLDVPARSHRPSRALRDEPAARALLTLVTLGHPQWRVQPSRYDVAYSLMQAVDEMDLVRGQLLAQIVYRPKEGAPQLTAWERINPDMRERISYVLGGRYDTLRLWLADSMRKGEQPLDHFLSRLFGEILSQRGHGFHDDLDAARVAATLVESVQKFRQAMTGFDTPPTAAAQQPTGRAGFDTPPTAAQPTDGSLSPWERAGVRASLGQEYIAMVDDGVLAAQYVGAWQEPSARDEAVLLAPAHTFLMMNRPVDYQFWLDIGSRGWYERLYQPLTHPYVLSRQWDGQRVWGDADEHAASQQRLYRLTAGLLRRCRKGIFLGLSELGEQGYEQRGPLLWAFNQVLRQLATGANADLGHF
jgi:hypothetical protein